MKVMDHSGISTTTRALLLVACAALGSPAFAEDPPLDRSLRTEAETRSGGGEISSVFRDMGVVQRKAMAKSGKLLFAPYISMDFSDGPFSMYGLNTDLGFALSDFWEIYFNAAPAFITSKRSIAQKIEALTLADGHQATITAALAQRQYGIELLWAPLYGKDSLGLQTIIRSDTFIKVGAAVIQYDTGENGRKFHIGVGKTYFIGSRAGFRFTASGNYVETIVDGVKAFNPVVMAELGLLFYLL
jgi:hypothetical protein